MSYITKFPEYYPLQRNDKSPAVKVNALDLMLVELQDLCLYSNRFLFSLHLKSYITHCITHIFVRNNQNFMYYNFHLQNRLQLYGH